MLRPLLFALQFLTRLPLPAVATPQPVELGRSMSFYPLVGLLLGGILAVLATLLDGLAPWLGAVLIMLAWLALVGILHLDGLADCADAWIGGQGEAERSLAIMKDPACGPAGVISLVMLLLIQFAALSSLLTNGQGWLLLFVPLLARSVLPLLFMTTPYLRAGGLGEAMAQHAPRGRVWGMSLAGLVVPLLVLPVCPQWTLPVMVLVTLAVFWLLRRASMQRLGGFTGDVAGALVVVTETALLLTVALM